MLSIDLVSMLPFARLYATLLRSRRAEWGVAVVGPQDQVLQENRRAPLKIAGVCRVASFLKCWVVQLRGAYWIITVTSRRLLLLLLLFLSSSRSSLGLAAAKQPIVEWHHP